MPHPFFIYHWMLEGKSIAAFMPAVYCQLPPVWHEEAVVNVAALMHPACLLM